MSGFVGWVQFDGRPVSRADLAALTAPLAQRGPDRLGLWCEGAAGFGHTLLATSPGAAQEQQPLVVRPGLVLVADARLDGREKLGARLRRLGGRLPAQPTDPDLIGQAWLAWGDRALAHLQGDFAFALWDQARQTLVCVRDPLGVKPLFYAQRGATLIIGNDLRCLRQHPAVSGALHEAAIADFLLFDFNRDPTTTSFQAVQRLPGGHWLQAQPERCQQRRYWTLPVPALRSYRRAADCLAEFQHHLNQAVGDRLPEGPAAIYLSGGLDSSTLAASARAVRPEQPLHGFTTLYRQRFPDPEAHYTPLVVAALGLAWHPLAADGYTLYQDWGTILRPPEPSHSPLLALDHDQLQHIVRHSRVALYGEGADEALQPSTVIEAWRGLPWRVSLRGLLDCLGLGLRPEWGTGLWAQGQRWCGRPALPLPPCPDWLNPDFARRTQAQARWQAVLQAKLREGPGARASHPWRSRAYAALTSDLWLPTLAACDPGFFNLPVETRLPFLDLRLLDFLLALPPLPWFVRKELLRQAGRDRLPPAILKRPKTPLAAAPFFLALQQGEGPWACLSGAASEIEAYVDRERLLASVQEYSRSPVLAWNSLRAVSLHHWLQQQSERPGCGLPSPSANTVESS